MDPMLPRLGVPPTCYASRMLRRVMRWMAGAAVLLMAPACATVRDDPQRVLEDELQPAPPGYFGPEETARIAPPESDRCTVATARECYERGLALASGEDGELDRLRALSLLSKACDGHIKEACQ